MEVFCLLFFLYHVQLWTAYAEASTGQIMQCAYENQAEKYTNQRNRELFISERGLNFKLFLTLPIYRKNLGLIKSYNRRYLAVKMIFLEFKFNFKSLNFIRVYLIYNLL